jgi:long-chain acyl-CoA synthetase
VTAEFMTERFRERPGASAVIAPEGRCTFGELATLCRDWGAVLEREKVTPGTVVGLEGDFSPNAIALFLALAARAVIVVPQCRGTGLGREVKDGLSGIEAYFRVDGEDAVSFERTDRTAEHPLYDELRRRGHPGLVQFSSGTSGEPKAAVSDLSLLLLKFQTPRPALATLAFLLFDHMGGINTMLHTLSNGAKLVSPGSRSPTEICRLIETHGVELLPATPTFFNFLLLSGAHRHHDLSSLRLISYGAEPMPATTLARLHAAFPGVNLQQTYGMVELGVLRTKSRGIDSLWLKVGGEGVETRVVDSMLQVRSRSQLLGYLNAPTPITEDGWLMTRDLVEQDGEYVRFLGRDSDLIVVGGEKVYPAEIEGAIESMEGVIEAVVFGEKNGILGEIVCAQVTIAGQQGDDQQVSRQIKRFCRERLERFKVPVKVQIFNGERLGGGVKKSRRQGGRVR